MPGPVASRMLSRWASERERSGLIRCVLSYVCALLLLLCVQANLQMVESLTAAYSPDFCLLEAGGDNLSANFSRELADFIIYVIDVAG